MCSIVGMAFQRGNKVKDNLPMHNIMRRLLVEGQVRGRRAAGVCFVNQRQFTVVKKNISGESLINTQEYDDAEAKFMHFAGKPVAGKQTQSPPYAVLGHNRLDTKGCPTNNSNNHPIVTGKVIGTHNGMIGNDDALFERYSKVITRIGQVDSEIIFALIDHFARRASGPGNVTKAIIETSKLITGGYACAAVHVSHPYSLFLFRNTMPCNVVHFDDIGVIMWASSEAFIRTATEQYNLGAFHRITIPQSAGIGIDLHGNKINHFDLENPKRRGYLHQV